MSRSASISTSCSMFVASVLSWRRICKIDGRSIILIVLMRRGWRYRIATPSAGPGLALATLGAGAGVDAELRSSADGVTGDAGLADVVEDAAQLWAAYRSKNASPIEIRFPQVDSTSLRNVSIFHFAGSGDLEHVRADTYSMLFAESKAATRGT